MRADGLRLPPPPQSEVYGEIERIRGNVQPRKFIHPAWVKYDETGFSESPASGGVDAGQWAEDEIAEAIFDWWISGKPYKQWYSDKYLQQEIEFDTE